MERSRGGQSKVAQGQREGAAQGPEIGLHGGACLLRNSPHGALPLVFWLRCRALSFLKWLLDQSSSPLDVHQVYLRLRENRLEGF